jgi:hypothetical protein
MESPSMMSDISDKAITPGTTTVNLLATANTNTMSDTEKSSQSGAARGGAEIKMAKGRKWLLLAIFSLAQVGKLDFSACVLYRALQTSTLTSVTVSGLAGPVWSSRSGVQNHQRP